MKPAATKADGSPRILIIIYSISVGGGAERITARIASAWAAKGADVTIVTLAPRAKTHFPVHPRVKVNALGIASTRRSLHDTLVATLGRVRALRREVRRSNPDVVIGVMFPTTLLAALAAFDRPTIGWEHNFPGALPNSTFQRFCQKFGYRLLDRTICLTQGSSQWLRRHTWARHVSTIPNAVEMPLESLEPAIAPESVCGRHRKIVLAAGRLCAQKNYRALISAFSLIAERHPSWDLVILGDGEERSMLERQLKTLKLDGRVFLPGYCGNIPDWYRRADLFALCSRFEGFPSVLLEAMAHGLPAVAYDCTDGPRDIIRPNLDGVLVPADDEAALARQLSNLMGNTELTSRMSSRAADVIDRFTEPRILTLWDELFQSMNVMPVSGAPPKPAQVGAHVDKFHTQ